MTNKAAGRPGAPVLLVSFGGLALFGSFWGATQPLTKMAVSTGYQPIGLIFWQLLFTSIWLGIVVAVRRLPVRISGRHLSFYIAISLLGTLVPNSFSYLAAARLPAGIMAVAIATVPIFSMVIALAVGNERFRVRRLFGVVLGVTALMMIAVPDASLPDPEMAPWLIVALIAPLCYGLEGNFMASRAPRDVNPVSALFAASVLGTLVSAPLAWGTGHWVDLSRPWSAPEWAIFVSSICHAIAYCGYMWLVGYAGVVFTSQIAYAVTAAGIGLSMLILGESYSLLVWLAILLMTCGLLLVQPAGKMPEAEFP